MTDANETHKKSEKAFRKVHTDLDLTNEQAMKIGEGYFVKIFYQQRLNQRALI